MEWKLSIVVLIPKPGKLPTDAGNMRTISLTISLCKTIERMDVNRVMWLLEKHEKLHLMLTEFGLHLSAQGSLAVIQTEITAHKTKRTLR